MKQLRRLNYPSAGTTVLHVVPPNAGGTGVTTLEEARTALNVVDASIINKPGGIAGAGPTGKLSSNIIPVAPSVTGPSDVNAYASGTFTITNFDSFITYSVSATKGTVSIDGDTITYTNTDGILGNAAITVNSKQIAINIIGDNVNTPSITAPVNGSTSIGGSVTFTGSAFGVGAGSDTHQSSDWQLATDSAFTSVIASAAADTVNKTSWTASGLSVITTYYVRCRYQGTTYGVSAWSPVSSFTTKTSFIPGTEQAVLAASDKATDDQLGYSVSVSGDGNTVCIGAPFHNTGGIADAGQAYIFVRSGTSWSQQALLNASDKASSDYFGFSVSISDDGNTVCIGAYSKINSSVAGAGKAYIFVRSGTTWSQQDTLSASDKAGYDYFGYSVAISGDGNTACIGAYAHNTSGLNDAGQAYIFVRSGTTWSQQAILAASDKAANDQFGLSVSINTDGNTVCIGAPYYDMGGTANVGQVYIFVRSGSTWSQQSILAASVRMSSDMFGYSVAISDDGNTVCIGAYYKTAGGVTYAGQAYIFTRSGSTWSEQAILSASDKATNDCFGWSVAISGNGNTVCIGASYHDTGGISETGQAYIFTRSDNTWTQQAILTANDKTSMDSFGWSVAISSDESTVCIGAIYHNPSDIPDAGQAYIFS